MQISQESTCVGVFFNKVVFFNKAPVSCLIKLQALGTAVLLKRDSNTGFFLSILGIIQEHLFRRESMNSWFWKSSAPFWKHLIYRTFPVAASDSFRFPACNFIKKETPAKMFICEFCKIYKIFRQKYLRMSASCVYLWILRSYSDHLFYRAPLGNCLFHLQVAQFQPIHTLKKWFYSKKVISAFQAFILEEKVAIRRRSCT